MTSSFPISLQPSWYSLSGYTSFYLANSQIIGNDVKQLSRIKSVACYLFRFIILPLAIVTAAFDAAWATLRMAVKITLAPLALLLNLFVQYPISEVRDFFSRTLKVCLIDLIASLIFPLVATGYAFKGKIVPCDRIENDSFTCCSWAKKPAIDLESINTAVTKGDSYTFSRIMEKLPSELITSSQSFSDYDFILGGSKEPYSASLIGRASKRISYGNIFFLRKILEKGFKITYSYDCFEVLFNVCKNVKNIPKVVNFFKDHGLLGETRFIFPSHFKEKWQIRSHDFIFLKKGASIIELAIGAGFVDLIPQLTKNGCEINAFHFKVFHKMIEEIIENKVDEPSHLLYSFYKNKTFCPVTNLIREKNEGEDSCNKNPYFLAFLANPKLPYRKLDVFLKEQLLPKIIEIRKSFNKIRNGPLSELQSFTCKNKIEIVPQLQNLIIDYVM